jgi:hypothetical protein
VAGFSPHTGVATNILPVPTDTAGGTEQIICLINKWWKRPLLYPSCVVNTFIRVTSAAGVFDRDDANRRDGTSQISVGFMVLHKGRLTHELAQPFT